MQLDHFARAPQSGPGPGVIFVTITKDSFAATAWRDWACASIFDDETFLT
jgi:hypothetical protein